MLENTILYIFLVDMLQNIIIIKNIIWFKAQADKAITLGVKA